MTCFEDVRPLRGLAGEVDWYYNGVFSHLLKKHHYKGTLGSALLVSTEGKLNIPKVVLIGLGKSTDYAASQFDMALARILETLSGLKVRESALEIDTLTSFSPTLETWQKVSSCCALLGLKNESASDQITLLMRDSEQAKSLEHSLHSEKFLYGSAS